MGPRHPTVELETTCNVIDERLVRIVQIIEHFLPQSQPLVANQSQNMRWHGSTQFFFLTSQFFCPTQVFLEKATRFAASDAGSSTKFSFIIDSICGSTN